LASDSFRYPAGLQTVGHDIYAWLTPNGSWGESNSLLVRGHGASLLIDTLWDLPRTRDMLQTFARHLAGSPIGTVVNTHADGDHWYGNQLTGARQVIATKVAARTMRRHGPGQMRALRGVAQLYRALARLPFRRGYRFQIAADYFEGMLRSFDFTGIRPLLPNRTFSGELSLEVGGRRIELFDVAPAHTSGDLIVHLPDDGIVATGDIIFAGCVPILWDGSVNHWIEACKRILALEPSVVVPGHGPVTDAAGVDATREYWEFLWDAARRQFSLGHTVARASQTIALSDEYRCRPFASWDGQERILINIDAIYRRLMKVPKRLGVLQKLKVLRQTALMAEFLRQAGSA
jgi:glyoxylase-like metal-dependent hydrolase (beta-lactamase superfamily II)